MINRRGGEGPRGQFPPRGGKKKERKKVEPGKGKGRPPGKNERGLEGFSERFCKRLMRGGGGLAISTVLDF